MVPEKYHLILLPPLQNPASAKSYPAARKSLRRHRLRSLRLRNPGRTGKDESRKGKIAPSGDHPTRRECAKAAGVGERTYDAGKLILKAAKEGKIEPKVVEDIRRGRTAIHRVAKDIKEKEQREARTACALASVGRETPTAAATFSDATPFEHPENFSGCLSVLSPCRSFAAFCSIGSMAGFEVMTERQSP
jgi:hypothetical protein